MAGSVRCLFMSINLYFLGTAWSHSVYLGWQCVQQKDYLSSWPESQTEPLWLSPGWWDGGRWNLLKRFLRSTDSAWKSWSFCTSPSRFSADVELQWSVWIMKLRMEAPHRGWRTKKRKAHRLGRVCQLQGHASCAVAWGPPAQKDCRLA